MKGVLLAGGTGTRLFPLTRVLSKQLLPIYDKPMIYYPLTTLMLAGVSEILIITTPKDAPAFKALLGDGRQWGISLSYAEQARPRGLAEAFIIGRDFLDGDACCLVLGDNLIYGDGLPTLLRNAAARTSGATVFGYRVVDPGRYAVVTFGAGEKPRAVVEKPKAPKSDWAVVGIYFYDRDAAAYAAKLKPSARGELEISDLNSAYLKRGALRVERLGRGYAWFDAGTHDSLIEASEFVRTIEKRTGQKIGCIEEIAFRERLIDRRQLKRLAKLYSRSDYGRYLDRLAEEGLGR
jgi:glucose-1-phosphate thymidylyltransferase